MNLPDIAEVWRRGSVIGSWLLDLTADALAQDPQLAAYGGRVSDSGEGRWTIEAAIDEGVPAPVLSAALYERFASRGEADFANQVLSAMRHEFGGHLEKPAGGQRRERRAPDAGRVDGAQRPARSDALVVFGFTGDLANKKIFPALYAMVEAGRRSTVPVIGVASSSLGTRRGAAARARQPRAGRRRSTIRAAFDKLLALIRYVSGDYKDAATFAGAEDGARRRPGGRRTTWRFRRRCSRP